MKRKIFLVLTMLMALLAAACGSAAPAGNNSSDNNANASQAASQSKILVAYFSHSGNTKALAQIIQRHTGGDLFEIVPSEPYPDSYNQVVERFKRERAADARPAIAGSVSDMANYDVVFVGYPNWGSDMPHIVIGFLEQYNLSGKTIVPFCTNGGGGFGNSLETLRRLCPNSKILDGYEINGRSAAGSDSSVARWLGEIGMGK